MPYFQQFNHLDILIPKKPKQSIEQEIDLSMLGQYRRVNNNRKPTRGRKIQYIQRARRLENGELKYLNSYKKIHHERV